MTKQKPQMFKISLIILVIICSLSLAWKLYEHFVTKRVVDKTGMINSNVQEDNVMENLQ